MPAFSCASDVLAPRWGVTTTLSSSNSGLSVHGSRGVYVEPGACHPALFERAGQGGLVHDPAAGSIDDAHLWLDQVQLAIADQPRGLGVPGQVDGDEVRLGQQLVEC